MHHQKKQKTSTTSAWNTMHSRSTCSSVRVQQFHTFWKNKVLGGSVNLTNKNLSPLQHFFFKQLKTKSRILISPISKHISIKTKCPTDSNARENPPAQVPRNATSVIVKFHSPQTEMRRIKSSLISTPPCYNFTTH